jgi:hypothetical protein
VPYYDYHWSVVVVGFYLVFKERFGVKVGFGANILPGIVGEVGTVHMQGIFLAGGFYHLRRFTEIKVSTTSELFSTTSELIPVQKPTAVPC